jgi:hypothetical protein
VPGTSIPEAAPFLGRELGLLSPQVPKIYETECQQAEENSLDEHHKPLRSKEYPMRGFEPVGNLLDPFRPEDVKHD